MDRQKPTALAYERTRLEVGQPEPGDVQAPAHLGVCRQQNLKATVEHEAVKHVRAHPSADPVRGLEHPALDAGQGQILRTGKTGKPGAHDYRLGHSPQRPSGSRHIGHMEGPRGSLISPVTLKPWRA